MTGRNYWPMGAKVGVILLLCFVYCSSVACPSKKDYAPARLKEANRWRDTIRENRGVFDQVSALSSQGKIEKRLPDDLLKIGINSVTQEEFYTVFDIENSYNNNRLTITRAPEMGDPVNKYGSDITIIHLVDNYYLIERP